MINAVGVIYLTQIINKSSQYKTFSLVLFLVGLTFYASPSFGEDCIKMVSNKFCLGGSFSKAVNNHKKHSSFKTFISKSKSGPALDEVMFEENNVLDLESAIIILSGHSNKIVQIRILPDVGNPEVEKNLRSFEETVKILRSVYCGPFKEMPQQGRVLLCFTDSMLIISGVMKLTLNDGEMEFPIIGYQDREFFKKHSDKGY